MVNKKLSSLKVAIVHDWLVGGGAERVVQELHEMFPDAPIYTSYATDEWRKKLDNKVITGFLQNWPFSTLRKFLPVLRIWWFTHLDFSDFDLVISSSGNGEAKGIKTPKGTTHVCYCHTPTHFYWRHYNKYLRDPGFGPFNFLARFGLRLLVGPLRHWDLKASTRPNYFIANSTHIKRDIMRFYKQDSIVIFPPVDVDRFANKGTDRAGFVTAGRQVPYKNIDIIVKACGDLGVPLTVVGRGPEHNNLVKLAGPSIKFDDNADDKAVKRYMNEAEAFIFAAYEDFGITPVEAMAAGTPVIAYEAGGALDYIIPGKTGTFFDKQTAASLEKVLMSFDPTKFDSKTIANEAQRFSQKNFRAGMEEFLSQITNEEK